MHQFLQFGKNAQHVLGDNTSKNHDYRGEDMPEVNQFGTYTLTTGLTDRPTQRVDSVL
jgi:hypothetical protein